jgi:hypothetical protein
MRSSRRPDRPGRAGRSLPPAPAGAPRLSLVALAAAAALAAACSSGPDTCLPECPADRAYDAIAYDLRGTLDWTARTLDAVEDITVVLTGSPVIELDARVAIDRVESGGTELGFDHDPMRGALAVDLGPVAGAGGEVTFTVHYRAPASSALVFATPRDDDPVTARVAYSNSEPDRGRGWLVSNDRPADRARFSVELQVGAGEDVIANGERGGERDLGGGRRAVRYAIEHPLPTYLMAFAAGALERVERTAGRVPIAVWHRRGAAVDGPAHLAVIERQLGQLEALVGPYPFERYAVVLIPGFPGGMENATITFNSEASGQGTINEGLNAHELAHQWFGDWVTMRDYRDAWVKEGLATLLAAEASRPTRDAEQRGRLFGASFNFDPADAIVDDSLTGLARYTSGPYERAAWLLTQIRARIGEAAFFGTLREVLAAHALGSIDGETFLRAFAPELDGAAIAQLLSTLELQGSPQIAVAVAGATVTLTLSDPSGMVLDPIPLTVIDASGGAAPRALAAGAPVTVEVPAGGYLAPDERDTHPYWYLSLGVPFETHVQLDPVLAPTAAPALAAFGTRSAGVQERAIQAAAIPGVTAAGLGALYASLDSSLARRGLVLDVCATLAGLPAADPEIGALSAALAPLLAAPATTAFQSGYARCARALPATSLPGELAALAAQGAALAPASLARVEYLLGFDAGAGPTLAAGRALADGAPSIRHRDLALDRLAQQARPPYSGVPAADAPAYRAYFRERLAGTTSGTRLLILWRGIRGVAALDALPDVGALLQRVPLDSVAQRRVACEAYAVAAGGAAWEAFRAAARPWDRLASDTAAVLADPARCAP